MDHMNFCNDNTQLEIETEDIFLKIIEAILKYAFFSKKNLTLATNRFMRNRILQNINLML